MLKFNGIGHVAFRTNDYEAELKYFTEKLGFRKMYDLRDENGEIFLTAVRVGKGQLIEVLRGTKLIPGNHFEGTNEKKDRSYFHTFFEIHNRHDVWADYVKRGLEPTYSEEDAIGKCGSSCSFIYDPHGNEFELMEYTDASLQLK